MSDDPLIRALRAEIEWLKAEFEVAPKNGARFAMMQRDTDGRIQNGYVTGARDVIVRVSERVAALLRSGSTPQQKLGEAMGLSENIIVLPDESAGRREAVASSKGTDREK